MKIGIPSPGGAEDRSPWHKPWVWQTLAQESWRGDTMEGVSQ